MSIVITGANGKLGRLIIEHLLTIVPADQIFACVRHTQSCEYWKKQGITVRLCDYDQPETLEQAFANASQLLLISSSHPDDTIRLRQHAHVIEAAKKAKVEHILYTSFAFCDKGTIPRTYLHLATEHAIRTTGIPYTFLRSGLYMDFIGMFGLNDAIVKGELSVYPGDWQFNSITRLDLAFAIVAVLTESGHQNKIYELTASHTWTFQDLAETLSELAGKPISLQQDPDIQNWIYGFLSKIDTTSTSDQLEQLLGHPITPLQESIKAFIS
ncbi:SDR family NAD(P)-dependent oxidoreductase [Paenibacillus albiflavus]|uniref:SDR family NAD(P)-dependent oxidoreductase n=1 Tax=Paenibacillus albiflavus TaxID=2545760 RepID=A0A4R4EAV0_9BACL|nr:NmrA family NAD(P)-binding protein [Paenibacillus albiflavus]TCZ75251.1 SDR family NAD(P)-dependent oxidoreductase [Paenibacillus albiflavus]